MYLSMCCQTATNWPFLIFAFSIISRTGVGTRRWKAGTRYYLVVQFWIPVSGTIWTVKFQNTVPGNVSFFCGWNFEKTECPDVPPGAQFDWECDPRQSLNWEKHIFSWQKKFNPSVPDSLTCVGSGWRHNGAFWTLRRDWTKQRHRRKSRIVSKGLAGLSIIN